MILQHCAAAADHLVVKTAAFGSRPHIPQPCTDPCQLTHLTMVCFAASRDDRDLDDMYRNQSRFGDPMAQYVRRRQSDDPPPVALPTGKKRKAGARLYIGSTNNAQGADLCPTSFP